MTTSTAPTKKKGGARPLPPELVRNRFVMVRFSEAEAVEVMKGAVRRPDFAALAVFVREAALEIARRDSIHRFHRRALASPSIQGEETC